MTRGELLRKARERVSLQELGIGNSKIRVAANGGIIVEVPGKKGSHQADVLAQKLNEAIGEIAIIKRLKKMGKLRISDLDDSITREEVIEIMSKYR